MTGTSLIYPDPVAAAHELKGKIHRELGFTVNVGISTNKLFGKDGIRFSKAGQSTHSVPRMKSREMWPSSYP